MINQSCADIFPIDGPTTNPQYVLERKVWQGITNEEKADWIASMPEDIEPRHLLNLINLMEAKLKERNK